MKRSNVGSDVMKGLRFSDFQESRFQAKKRSYMASAVLQGGLFAMYMNCFFIIRNVRIGLFELQLCLFADC